MPRHGWAARSAAFRCRDSRSGDGKSAHPRVNSGTANTATPETPAAVAGVGTAFNNVSLLGGSSVETAAIDGECGGDVTNVTPFATMNN